VPLAYQSIADLMPAVETVTALHERSDFSAGQATAAFWTKPVRASRSPPNAARISMLQTHFC
jgi:hypothetical protein